MSRKRRQCCTGTKAVRESIDVGGGRDGLVRKFGGKCGNARNEDAETQHVGRNRDHHEHEGVLAGFAGLGSVRHLLALSCILGLRQSRRVISGEKGRRADDESSWAGPHTDIVYNCHYTKYFYKSKNTFSYTQLTLPTKTEV